MNNTQLTDHGVELNDLKISNKYPLTLISGPCQLESLEHAMMIAEKLIEICDRNAINFVFKSSLTKPTELHTYQSVVLELTKVLKSFKN